MRLAKRIVRNRPSDGLDNVRTGRAATGTAWICGSTPRLAHCSRRRRKVAPLACSAVRSDLAVIMPSDATGPVLDDPSLHARAVER